MKPGAPGSWCQRCAAAREATGGSISPLPAPAPHPAPSFCRLLSRRQVDAVAVAEGPANPCGNAWTVKETDLLCEAEAQRVCDATVGRYWKVKNPASKHPTTGEQRSASSRHGHAVQCRLRICLLPAQPLPPLSCRQACGLQAGAHALPPAAGGAQQQHRQAGPVCHAAPVGDAAQRRRALARGRLPHGARRRRGPAKVDGRQPQPGERRRPRHLAHLWRHPRAPPRGEIHARGMAVAAPSQGRRHSIRSRAAALHLPAQPPDRPTDVRRRPLASPLPAHIDCRTSRSCLWRWWASTSSPLASSSTTPHATCRPAATRVRQPTSHPRCGAASRAAARRAVVTLPLPPLPSTQRSEQAGQRVLRRGVKAAWRIASAAAALPICLQSTPRHLSPCISSPPAAARKAAQHLLRPPAARAPAPLPPPAPPPHQLPPLAPLRRRALRRPAEPHRAPPPPP